MLMANLSRFAYPVFLAMGRRCQNQDGRKGVVGGVLACPPLGTFTVEKQSSQPFGDQVNTLDAIVQEDEQAIPAVGSLFALRCVRTHL
jgi:hypothetical protein